MFLPPFLLLATTGFPVCAVANRRAQPATGIVDAPARVAVQRIPFWPTTVAGTLAIGAFAVGFLPIALVNAIQVRFLGEIVLLAALVLSGVAGFAKHDHSTSVLIASGVSALAGLLFLAGEVFIGNDEHQAG